MSKSFDPVDFDTPEDEALKDLNDSLHFDVVKTELEFDRDKFNEAIAFVEQTISEIGNGNTDLMPVPIIVDDRLPTKNALRQLKSDPWPDKLRVFLALVRQDFNERVRRAFAEKFEGVFESCQKK